MTEHRPVIISCDGHAAGQAEDYGPYIDPAYRHQFDEWVTAQRKAREAMQKMRDENKHLFSKEGSEKFEAETGDGRDGEFDSAVRRRALEDDGIVAEVLFPNPGVPFGAFGENADHELRGVGNRAYDRWLVDFAADLPGRRAALAMLAVHDVDECVAEVEWAAANGMKGVVIPTTPGKGLPPWVDDCYDPIWAACEDTDLPVHLHSGGGTPNYGDYGVVSMILYATETTFFGRRPFWHLLWAGVLDRHPRMRLVITEARAEWVPETLKLLDGIYEASFFSHIKEMLTMRPSEYWARQCSVTASFMSADEAAIRHDIGLSSLMWGADYPHVEGTWPKSRKALARCFDGVPLHEASTILAENPARVYGFDLEALQPIANEVCPTAEELVGAP